MSIPSLLLALALQASAPFASYSINASNTAFHAPRLEVEIRYDSVRKDYLFTRRTRMLDAAADAAKVSHAQSSTCPGVMPVLTALSDLPTSKIRVPGIGPANDMIVLDGAAMTLKAGFVASDTADGEITLSSNYDTPHAKWIVSAQKALGPCWKEAG